MARSVACILICCSLLLAGCSHTVYISDLATGASGQTSVETFGKSGGPISLPLEGKIYNGRWIYVPGPATFSLASLSANSMATDGTTTVTAMGTATGYGYAGSTMGNGSILMSAGPGSSLRCVFDFNSMSSTGLGACRDEAGGMYDIQISR